MAWRQQKVLQICSGQKQHGYAGIVQLCISCKAFMQHTPDCIAARMLRTDCLEEQELPCTYLAHHELECIIIVLIVIIIIIIARGLLT